MSLHKKSFTGFFKAKITQPVKSNETAEEAKTSSEAPPRKRSFLSALPGMGSQPKVKAAADAEESKTTPAEEVEQTDD